MDRYPDTIFDELDREWDHLQAGGRLDRALGAWRQAEESLAGFDDALDLVAALADHDRDPEQQSEVLLALLRIAPHDALAVRLVLHRFVPALKRIAGWRQPFPHADWVGQIVSEAYEVIATYPVDRRRERVAANIVWEVRKRMYGALADYRRAQAELGHDECDEPTEASDPTDGVLAAQQLGWAWRRARIPRETMELILLTRVAGYTIEEVADRLGEPSARLRQRRWRVEQRLRGLLEAA